jgi:hypothetical protein
VARNRLLGFDRPIDRLAGGDFTAVQLDDGPIVDGKRTIVFWGH